MNKARRKKLSEEAKMLRQAIKIIKTAADEENTAFENLTEGLRYTARGMNIDYNISAMDEATIYLEEYTGQIEQIVMEGERHGLQEES